MSSPMILAIDAASRFGFAVGRAGTIPQSGSGSFAKGKSPSHEAIFAGAMRWITTAVQDWQPDIIVVEAPLPTSFVQGKSNVNTARILTGLPAALGGMAHLLGVYDFQVANLSSVRSHFIGKGNIKSEIAKPQVMAKARAMGWILPDDEDHTFDRSDALAVWSFAEAKVAPRLTQPVDDLFLRRNGK